MGRNPTGRIPPEQGKPALPAKPVSASAPLSLVSRSFPSILSMAVPETWLITNNSSCFSGCLS